MSEKANFHQINRKELDKLSKEVLNGSSRAFDKLSIHVKDISHSYFISKHYAGKIINRDDVDDLTNNVFLTFAEQHASINNIEHWLRRVLFLTFVNWYKKEKKKPEVELDESYYKIESETKKNDPFDIERIMTLVKTLSGEKQEIIKFRFWEELKFSDIAEKIGKSEAAVKKMFYRTIEELAKRV